MLLQDGELADDGEEEEGSGRGPPTAAVVRSVELYAVCTYLFLLSIGGTAGNALVLFVFRRKKDDHVSTVFIMSLAFVDLVTCVLAVPLTIYLEYFDFRTSVDALCKFYQFLIASNIPFSALIMVAIAIDRYLCICRPYLRAFTIYRARIVVCLLGLLAAGLGVFASLGLRHIRISQADTTQRTRRPIPDLGQSHRGGTATAPEYCPAGGSHTRTNARTVTSSLQKKRKMYRSKRIPPEVDRTHRK